MQAKAGKEKTQWDKQQGRPDDCQQGASDTLAHRLKEYGKDQRGDQRQKAGADDPEANLPDFYHLRVGGKYTQHLCGDSFKAENAGRHQRHAEQDCGG